MTYHMSSIPRGTFGHFDKIVEEYLEFKDAIVQQCCMMAVIELSDMLGAILEYAEQHERHDIIAQHQYLLKQHTSHNGIVDIEWTPSPDDIPSLLMHVHHYLASYQMRYYDAFVMHTITKRAFTSGART